MKGKRGKFFVSSFWFCMVMVFFLLLGENVKAATKGSVRAMILIGDGYAVTSEELMKDFFEGNTMGGYSVESVRTYGYNDTFGITQTDIDQCMDEAFQGSTDKDICFFYYGGHGAYNIDTKKGLGLTLTETTYYDYGDLAEKLSTYKGKIYVILDCCYAGQFIESVKKVPAFQKDKGRIAVMTASGNKKTGLKFFKSGWDIIRIDKKYQRFTYMISKGVGTRDGDSLKADKNKDGAVTLRELYNYVNNAINTSNPQYYGDKNTILYKASISLNRNRAVIYLSEKKIMQLRAKVSVPNAKIKWSSSNRSVAYVNSKGKVTVKRSGTVTITAKSKGLSAKCKIIAKKVRSSIKLNRTRATLYTTKKNSIRLIATVKGESSKVKWTSSDKTIATVSSKGMVKAKKAGTAVITAKAGNLTAKCIINVEEPDDFEMSRSKMETLLKGSWERVSSAYRGYVYEFSENDFKVYKDGKLSYTYQIRDIRKVEENCYAVVIAGEEDEFEYRFTLDNNGNLDKGMGLHYYWKENGEWCYSASSSLFLIET